MDWTAEAWEGALAAMRERSSVAEILALYEDGTVSLCEVLEGAWSQCHDDPTRRAELVRQFRGHPGEFIADFVGGGLEELAAQVAERRSGGSKGV